MVNKTRQKVGTIKAWIKRRRARGEEPTADEIYAHIKKNWPTLSAVARETIFQECD